MFLLYVLQHREFHNLVRIIPIMYFQRENKVIKYKVVVRVLKGWSKTGNLSLVILGHGNSLEDSE